MGDHRAKLLIVEDELFIALLLESLANDAGFLVVGPVDRLDDACAAAASEELDAAVLDVHLRGGELSYPVAAILAQREIPYAFVTSEPRAQIAKAHSTKPYLAKPFLEIDFTNLLARLVPALT